MGRLFGAGIPADQPLARTDANSLKAHDQLLEKARKGGIDVYFEGDSITRRWGATDYPELLANWNSNFHGWNAADFGWGADTLQNILWRLDHGELDGVHPKVVVLFRHTNNVGSILCRSVGSGEKAEDILEGYKAVLGAIQLKAPEAVIIVTAIFPRNDKMAAIPLIDEVDQELSKLADGKKILFLDINDQLSDKNGKLFDGMTRDHIHPTLKGYQIWADRLKPILARLLGPPGPKDHAPPPTGDPGRGSDPARR